MFEPLLFVLRRMTAEDAFGHAWLASVHKAVSSRHVDAEVLGSLRRFHKFGALKRKVLEAIAFSMSSDKIRSLRYAFMKMDVSGSGFITREQMQAALVTEGVTPKEVGEIFSKIDEDGDNFISYSEFLAAALDRKVYLTEERLRDSFQK